MKNYLVFENDKYYIYAPEPSKRDGGVVSLLTWNTHFLMIYRKNYNVKSVRVDNATYNYPSGIGYIKLDISDFLRAENKPNVRIYHENDLQYVYEFQYTYKGMQEIVSELIIPKSIPIHFPIAEEFYVSFYLPKLRFRWRLEQFENGEWRYPLTVRNYPQHYEILPTATSLRFWDTLEIASFPDTFDQSFDKSFHPSQPPYRQREIVIRLDKLNPCKEYFLLEWKDEHGMNKNWWFEKRQIIRGWSKSIQTWNSEYPDNYNVQKNKTIGFMLSHQKADLITRKYLADIVYSDEVYLWHKNERNPINISNKSIVVNDKDVREDFNISVDFKFFDTI